MFGKMIRLSGKGNSDLATYVPLEVLQNVKLNPLPITISGSNNVTFSLAGSVTRPAVLWVGDDFVSIRTSLSYTFTANATNTILASTGAVTTLQSPATGVWYFYVGYDSDGALKIYPSQTAPSYVQVSSMNSSVLAHPGTSRDAIWAYVGFTICNATTPTFLSMSKIGYTYIVASTASYTTVATTSTAWLERTLVLPKHAAAGLTVGGYVETGAAGTVAIGSTSSSTVGIQKFLAQSSSGACYAPFDNLPPTANGKIWAQDTTSRGDLHVTKIHDVV